MRAIGAAYIEQEGIVTLGVRPEVMFGNAIVAICNMARFAAFEPVQDTSGRDTLAMTENVIFNRTMTPPHEWEYLLTKPRSEDKKKEGVTSLDLFILADLFDKELLSTLDATVQKLFAVLRQDKADVSDWGFCVMRDLCTTTDDLSPPLKCTGYGMLPSLGRAAPKLVGSMGFQAATSPFSWPHYLHKDVSVIRRVLARLDRWRWDESMFHVPDPIVADVTRRDRMYGGIEAVKWLARRTQAWSLLYTLAAMKIWRAPNAGLRVACAQQYEARKFNYSSDLEEAQREAEQYLDDLIPLPPLGSYFASAFSGLGMTTQIGPVSAATLFNANAAPDLGSVLTEVCPDTRTKGALADLYAKSLREIGNALASDPRCMSRGFGVTESSHADYRSTEVTAVELAAALKASPGLVEEMRTVAKLLGWPSLSADLGVLDANGANFNICDGVMGSESPDRSLLGLTPTVSMANRKVMGVRTLIQQSFYPSSIGMWAVPVKGEVDALNRSETYRRAFIPVSMGMGEADAIPMSGMSAYKRLGSARSTSVASPLIESLIRFWVEYAPAFIRENYGTVLSPSEVGPAGVTFGQSDWDPYAIASGKEVLAPDGPAPGMTNAWVRRVTDEWLRLNREEGGAGVTEHDDLVFLRRANGQPFYARCLVASALPDGAGYYQLLNKMGLLIDKTVIPFQGDVLYDNEIKLAHDFAVLDKLLAAAPPRSGKGSATVSNVSATLETL